MITKRVYFDNINKDVYLDIYVADRLSDFTRKAILVLPGGGYGAVSSSREGEPIAMAFIPHGYNAFVLHYTVGRKKTYPSQLLEASMAMKYIKEHANEFNIDPEKVFVVGFSAGGHLAGSLGIMWHKEEIYQAIDMHYGYNKPAGMMLIYPVVSGVAAYSHAGSFKNLLGTDSPEKERLAECSLELNVSKESVPLFLVHSSNDHTVDVRNSLCLAEKYKEEGLLFEMHIYPDSPHGFALSNSITHCGVKKWQNPAIAKWVEHAVEWAEGISL